MDRITPLPDSLLRHILSFLPTKTSVSTSLLSRRWPHLWQHLAVSDFDQHPDEFDDDELFLFRRFAFFVNGVLALRKERDIKKFSLSCSYRDDDDDDDSFHEHSVTYWVLAAIGGRFQELNLFLCSPHSLGFHLPHCVLTCMTLVSLTLDGAIIIEQPPSVNLPFLKTLSLHIHNVTPIDKLLSGCPVLEALNLFYDLGNARKLSVPSSLKSLTFSDFTDLEIDEFVVDAPALEYLNIAINGRCHHFSLNNLDNVVEAHLNFYPKFRRVDEHDGLIVTLIRALYRTKFLFSCVSTTECLLHASILDFPKFWCLLRLELQIPCFNSGFMTNLLHKCHVLQVLRIHNFQRTPVQTSYPGDWTCPTSVPECLVSHLTIIEFRTYEGFQR